MSTVPLLRGLKRTALLAWFLGWVLCGGASMAHAQATQSDKPPPDDASGFVAVPGPTQQDVSGSTLLVLTYGIIWLLLLTYVFRLARLQTRIRGDVERLQDLLRQASNKRP